MRAQWHDRVRREALLFVAIGLIDAVAVHHADRDDGGARILWHGAERESDIALVREEEAEHSRPLQQFTERRIAGLYRAGVRPWQLTIASLAMNAVIGWLLLIGGRALPGLLLIPAGIFDVLDGGPGNNTVIP